MIRVRYDFHPLAEIFPLMEGPEFAALALDIREHGLREPIILHEGKILDGRNRYRACIEANVNPKTEPWDQEGTAEAFVVSKNLHRRHLSESQRAMIGATFATRKREDTLKPGGLYANPLEVQIPTSSMSAREAADLLNVSRHLVFDAKTVLHHGTPEEIQSVKNGGAAASTVADQIRKKTPPVQREKQRAAPLSQTGRNPERIQRAKVKAEVWGRIRDVLTHLTSLPLPADVAAIARALDKTGLVDARLAQSQKWLEEFAHEWSQRRQDAA